MDANKNSIITEDGKRLTIDEGLITGTEDPGSGLAYETGNVMDEKKQPDNEVKKNACPTPSQKNNVSNTKQ
jgi:hypothetical protein